MKLDDALKERLDDIEMQRETKKLEEIRKRAKKKKKPQSCTPRFKVPEPIDRKDFRKKRLTLTQEQRKVHEAYQILLSEYPKRIKRHMRQKRPP